MRTGQRQISASSTAALASVLFQRQSHPSRPFLPTRPPASKVVEDVIESPTSLAAPLAEDPTLLGPPMQIGATARSDAVNLQESLAELGRVLSYPDFVDRAFAEGSPHRVDMLRIFLEAHIDEDCPATVQTGFLILFRNTPQFPAKI